MTAAEIAGAPCAFDWDAFAERDWDRRPAFFKNPFGQPPLAIDDLFWMLVHQGDTVRRGGAASVVLFDRERRGLAGGGALNRYMKDLAERLPAAADGSMAGYAERLAREERYREFGIYFDNAQLHEKAFRAAREILFELYRRVPMRAAPLNIDVFLGNYSSTAFGVHRDPLDNIMLMIEGKKTMRLWSDEVWKGKLGNPDSDTHTTHDYARFLGDAQTFTLEAGDVLYWPYTYWHVGENDGAFSASINLDFKMRHSAGALDACVEGAFASAIDQFKRRLARRGTPEDREIAPDRIQEAAAEIPEDLMADARALQARLAGGADLELFLHSRWLTRLSAFGFMSGPMRRAPRELGPNDRVAADPRFPILHAKVGGRLLLSHSGHLKIVRDDEAHMGLIEDINRGSGLAIGDLVDRFGGAADGSPETELARQGIRELLEELRQVHAVDLVG